MAFAVVIHEKGGQPRRQEFYKSEVTIGRVPGNDIVLPKQNVSKRHSRIVFKNGKFVITDLKSTNGTYLSGRKISAPAVIKDTDKIYIGDFVISTEAIEGAEGAEAPVGATPPPPPSPFSGGAMPAQTIASGVSPFASPEGEGSPMTMPAMPAMPAAPSTPAPPPPAPPAPVVAPPPPAPMMAPPPPTPAPAPPAPTPAPPAPMMAPPPPAPASPFSMPATSPEPAVPAPDASSALSMLSATPASSAPVQAAPAPVQAAPALVPKSTSPSVRDQSGSGAALSALHQALSDGLHSRNLTLPTTYHPALSPRAELLKAVSELLDGAAQGHPDVLVDQVMDEALSVGCLHALIQDDQVSEVYLNGAEHLSYVKRDGSVHATQAPFSSAGMAQLAAARIVAGMGAQLGEALQFEGQLSAHRVYIDLSGSAGPSICLQRGLQQATLARWSQEGRCSAEIAQQLTSCLAGGGKVAIASRSPLAQAQLASAVAHERFVGRRAVSVGLSYALGFDAAWLALPCDMDALMSVSALTPEAVIISDQAGFDGALALEVLAAAPAGLMLTTARSAEAAMARLKRRALDAELVKEALDYVVFVELNAQGQGTIKELYDVAQGRTVHRA